MFENSLISEQWHLKIHEIQKQFFSCYNIKLFDWQDVFQELSEADCGLQYQISLIRSTVNHKINEIHPVRISYQQAFLKYIISGLEQQGVEVDADIYETYCRLMKKKDSSTHFRHFIFENNPNCNEEIYITIEESINLISQGTTGLHSWQAALGLADYCLQNKDIFEGKTILELGSGIGLTGLAVTTSNIFSCRYIFTDCHLAVLKLLCSNIKLNSAKYGGDDTVQEDNKLSAINDRIVLQTKVKCNSVKVLNLPWEEFTDSIVAELSPNIILAADVVYDISVFEALIKAFTKCLFSESQCLLLACTVRNADTLNSFLDLIGPKFRVSGLNFSRSKSLVYDDTVEIKLYKIVKIPEK